MRLARTHRRLTIAMGLTALLAFAGGAGFSPLSAFLATGALILGLFWQPDSDLSLKLEQVWLPLAFILVVRSLYHVVLVGDDVVIPVVDLLLLLMCAEALRSLDAPNDVRLYALSFALLLASTAYRPGLLFAGAFLAYVVLATVGLMTGHLKRQAEMRSAPDPELGRGFLWKMTALSGVVLATSAIVFVAFPRISRGWASRGEVLATSIVGFSDEVSIGNHGARIYPNPEIVLRVEFPEGAPPNVGSLYWRGRSYDGFDGVRWTRSDNLPSSVAPTQWYERWGSERTYQRIYGAPLDVNVLFALHPVLGIQTESRRLAPLFDNAGDHIYWGSGQPTYDAVSVSSRPPADSLRAAAGGFRPARAFYTQVPRLPERVTELAESLVSGQPTLYDRVMAVQSHFADFTYTIELPRSAREATLDHFLFERRAGHCEYYSTAMAVLLRSQGILARNVNGFLSGQWNEFGQYLAVTQNEAHSWVEVWFPGYGWVPFDPTPPATGSSETLQSWMWPGRFWFDGLRHRWNKWILDYNVDAQGSLLSRAQEIFTPEPRAPVSGTDSVPDSEHRWTWLVLFGVAGALGFAWVQTSSVRHPRETRAYLRLRAAYEAAGLPTRNDLAPMDIVDALRARAHPAHRPAEHVVRAYLGARFGGISVNDDDWTEMNRALAAAQKAMRRNDTSP